MPSSPPNLIPQGPLTNLEFLALDLETTGLKPQYARVVEFGAIRFRLDGGEMAVFSQLVNPGRRIPWAAKAVHGIDDPMVADQPPAEQVTPKFWDFLRRPQTLLMAHNASFDWGFLQAEMERCGHRPTPLCIIDTLDLAKRRLRGLRSYRLADLSRQLGLAGPNLVGGAHRAVPDCRVLKNLFLTLIQMSPPLQTTEQLLRLSPPLNTK